MAVFSNFWLFSFRYYPPPNPGYDPGNSHHHNWYTQQYMGHHPSQHWPPGSFFREFYVKLRDFSWNCVKFTWNLFYFQITIFLTISIQCTNLIHTIRFVFSWIFTFFVIFFYVKLWIFCFQKPWQDPLEAIKESLKSGKSSKNVFRPFIKWVFVNFSWNWTNFSWFHVIFFVFFAGKLWMM